MRLVRSRRPGHVAGSAALSPRIHSERRQGRCSAPCWLPRLPPRRAARTHPGQPHVHLVAGWRHRAAAAVWSLDVITSFCGKLTRMATHGGWSERRTLARSVRGGDPTCHASPGGPAVTNSIGMSASSGTPLEQSGVRTLQEPTSLGLLVITGMEERRRMTPGSLGPIPWFRRWGTGPARWPAPCAHRSVEHRFVHHSLFGDPRPPGRDRRWRHSLPREMRWARSESRSRPLRATNTSSPVRHFASASGFGCPTEISPSTPAQSAPRDPRWPSPQNHFTIYQWALAAARWTSCAGSEPVGDPAARTVMKVRLCARDLLGSGAPRHGRIALRISHHTGGMSPRDGATVHAPLPVLDALQNTDKTQSGRM